MPCRAGITTDPERRKQYWESQVIGFKNWTLYGPYTTREAAQKEEDRLVKGGCKGHPGGSNPDDKSKSWYAYRFDYTREN